MSINIDLLHLSCKLIDRKETILNLLKKSIKFAIIFQESDIVSQFEQYLYRVKLDVYHYYQKIISSYKYLYTWMNESFTNILNSNEEGSEPLNEIEILKLQNEQMKEKINSLTKRLQLLSENWEEYLNYPNQIKKLSRSVVRFGKNVISQGSDQQGQPKRNCIQIKDVQLQIHQGQMQRYQLELCQKQQRLSQFQKRNNTLHEKVNQLLKEKEQFISLKLQLKAMQEDLQKKNLVINEKDNVIKQIQIKFQQCENKLKNQQQIFLELSIRMNESEREIKEQKHQILELKQLEFKLQLQNKQLFDIQKNLLLNVQDLNNNIKSHQTIIKEQEELLVDYKKDENLDERIINDFQILLNRFKSKLKESKQDMISGLQNMKKEMFKAMERCFKNTIQAIQ